MPYYSTDDGLEWKTAILGDSVMPASAVNMRSNSNSVSIIIGSKVFLSVDGGANYKEYVETPNIDFVDYSLYSSNKLAFASNKVVVNIPFEGISWNDMRSRNRTNRILVNDAGTAAVIRSHHNGQYWQYSVYRKLKDEDWVSSDTVSAMYSSEAEEIQGAVLSEDNTLYLTTPLAMKRLLPHSSTFEIVRSGSWANVPRVIVLQNNILYRTEYAGLIEKCTPPVSTRITEVTTKSRPLDIYPLPAKNHVTVSGLLPGTLLKVVDVSGRVLLQQTIEEPMLQLDLSSFPAGVYSAQTDESTAMIVVEK